MNENPKYKKNVIVNKTFDFAVLIVKFSEQLDEKRKFVVAKQILRSGTSIGANVREAQNAASMPDFINKMKIAAKEMDETEYWLLLCEAAYKTPESKELLEKLMEIRKIMNKIISTSKIQLANSQIR